MNRRKFLSLSAISTVLGLVKPSLIGGLVETPIFVRFTFSEDWDKKTPRIFEDKNFYCEV